MNRRQLLATSGIAAVGFVSGCSGLSTKTELSAEKRQDDNETHVVFPGDETIFQLTIWPRADRVAFGQHISLTTMHAKELRLESFRFALRVPASGEEPQVTTLLETPGSGAEYLRFHRAPADIHTSVIEMQETGVLGEGSLSLNLVILPQADESPDGLAVAIEAELTDESLFETKYLAKDRVVVGLP